MVERDAVSRPGSKMPRTTSTHYWRRTENARPSGSISLIRRSFARRISPAPRLCSAEKIRSRPEAYKLSGGRQKNRAPVPGMPGLQQSPSTREVRPRSPSIAMQAAGQVPSGSDLGQIDRCRRTDSAPVRPAGCHWLNRRQARARLADASATDCPINGAPPLVLLHAAAGKSEAPETSEVLRTPRWERREKCPPRRRSNV
jgi:hypothetical protein